MAAVETPKYINELEVERVLTWQLTNLAVEQALKATSKKVNKQTEQTEYVNQPARSITFAGKAGILLTMPSFVAQQTEQTLACKLVTSFEANESKVPKLPKILANILLFSMETGQLQCIMAGTQITAWRTAAASIVSTKYLYFNRLGLTLSTPIKLAIIGCGTQGRSHAFGMCNTFKVSELQLWNRTTARAETLATDLKTQFAKETQISVAASAAEAVAHAHIICVATYSASALVNYEMLPKHSVHINTVGAGKIHFGEVAQDIYDRGVVYVDSWSNAATELQELKANIVAEVGEIINGSAIFSQTEGISILQSMGMGAEDATVAQAVYNKLKLK